MTAVLVFLIVVLSTVERATIELGGASIFPGHVIAAALVIPAIRSLSRKSSLLSPTLSFAIAGVILLIPSVVLLDGADVRARFVLQFGANVVVFMSVLGLALGLRKDALRGIVFAAGTLVILGSLIQLFVEPAAVAGQGSRFLGIPRPYGLFTEAAWFTTYLSLLLAASCMLKQRTFATVLAVIVFVLFTRGAVVIALCALLGNTDWVRSRKWVQVSTVIGVSALGLWFFAIAMFGSKPLDPTTSLDSRAAESWVIRAANDFDLWPFGGEILNFQFRYYWQATPEASNVAGLDFAWKFGFLGLAVFAMFWWVLVVVWPRNIVGSSLNAKSAVLPGLLALAAVPPTMQFNNAFGRPWFWAGLALILAVMYEVVTRRDEVECFGAENGLDVSVPANRRSQVRARRGTTLSVTLEAGRVPEAPGYPDRT